MIEQKKCKCDYEFQPKEDEYKITVRDDGGVEIMLSCPSCNEDIEFSIIHKEDWILVMN